MVERIRGWLDQVVVSRMFLRDPLSKEMTDWIRSGASNVCSMSWEEAPIDQWLSWPLELSVVTAASLS